MIYENIKVIVNAHQEMRMMILHSNQNQISNQEKKSTKLKIPQEEKRS